MNITLKMMLIHASTRIAIDFFLILPYTRIKASFSSIQINNI